MPIQTIKNRYSQEDMLSGDFKSIRDLLEDAYRKGAYLRGAYLRDANLPGAYLRGAYLRDADLQGADLQGADLRGADLRGAYLRGAYLQGAYLQGADLQGADLQDAYLQGADLQDAYLQGADLPQNDPHFNLALAKTRILPSGTLIGWKKADNGVIVELEIPKEASRSHAFGRKCRAEFVNVIALHGGKEAFTQKHGPRVDYIPGMRVTPDSWNPDWTNECSHGIHFFITREEAEAYAY